MGAGAGRFAPPTVYRASTALIEQRCAHRPGSFDAFIACHCDGHRHASVLSICEDCGTVEESTARDLLRELSSIVGRSGFAPLRHTIGDHGVCAACGAGKGPREAGVRNTAIARRPRRFQRTERDH